MDKKIYQKMIRYEEDKRYLYQKYLQDKNRKVACDRSDLNLEFQSIQAQKQFELSLPRYITESEDKMAKMQNRED